MPDEEFLEHDNDAYHWIVTSLEWNIIYTENSDILDLFISVNGERVFDNQDKFICAQFYQHLTDY